MKNKAPILIILILSLSIACTTDIGPLNAQRSGVTGQDTILDPPATPTIDERDPPAVLAPHVIQHLIPNILYPENVTKFRTDDMRRAIWANHVLGEGKTAKVYKGMLNGRAVAVKQIKNNSTLDSPHF
jgi:hypothetical protein